MIKYITSKAYKKIFIIIERRTLMKKLISLIIVTAMMAFSNVTVFAAENKDLDIQIEEFQEFVTECESYYIYYDYMQPPIGPFWSELSMERMTEAVDVARKTAINSEEELAKAKTDFNHIVSTMTLEKEELEFMVSLFEKEKNDNNYYDEETWNGFQSVLAYGKQALQSEDEELMYHSYIKMRNTFNNICKYNTEYADFNGDGVLNITDITLAQKYLVNSVEFNYSQCTIAQFNYCDFLRIDDLTNLQKYIVGNGEKMKTKHLDNVLSLQDLDISTRKFIPEMENSNYIYYVERNNYFDNLYL